jgi:hypothetical protein
MKLFLLVLGAALLAGGLGIACGPKEKYCFEEGMTCKAVRTELVRQCELRNEPEHDAGRPGEDCTKIPLTVEEPDERDGGE